MNISKSVHSLSYHDGLCQAAKGHGFRSSISFLGVYPPSQSRNHLNFVPIRMHTNGAEEKTPHGGWRGNLRHDTDYSLAIAHIPDQSQTK